MENRLSPIFALALGSVAKMLNKLYFSAKLVLIDVQTNHAYHANEVIFEKQIVFLCNLLILVLKEVMFSLNCLGALIECRDCSRVP